MAAPADPQPRPTRGGKPGVGSAPDLQPRGVAEWEDWRGGGGEERPVHRGGEGGGGGGGRPGAGRGQPRGAQGSRGGRKGWAGRGGGRESPAPTGRAAPGALSEPAAAARAYLCQKGRARDAGRREALIPAAPRCRRRSTARGLGAATGSGEWAGRGGSGRGTARLQWLLRVTGRAGPRGRKRHACANAAEEAGEGATAVAREGEGRTSRGQAELRRRQLRAGGLGRGSKHGSSLTSGGSSQRPLAPPRLYHGAGPGRGTKWAAGDGRPRAVPPNWNREVCEMSR